MSESISESNSSLSSDSSSKVNFTVSKIPCDNIFKGAITKKEASKLVEPGRFITFYPLPDVLGAIPAKIHLHIAQQVDTAQTNIMELIYDETGWCISNAKKPRPAFDTLPQLLDFYSTFSDLNIQEEEHVDEDEVFSDDTTTKTVFEK